LGAALAADAPARRTAAQSASVPHVRVAALTVDLLRAVDVCVRRAARRRVIA
jgi:hypothetical protein